MPYTTTEPRVYYEVRGQGPAIIWSHGLMMDHEMFEEQVDQFSKSYTCISWDERAHGKTAEQEEGAFSYYDSASDLMRILDELGIEKAILAGMSQGGYLGLRAALRYPARVRGLILIATQAMVDDLNPPEFHERTKRFDPQLAQDSIDAEGAKLLSEVIMNPRWPGTAYWERKWQGYRMSHVLRAVDCLVSRDDIQPLVHEIRVPCILIHGSDDRGIPLANAKALHAALPDSEMLVIEGENHAPNMSSPVEVNAAIARFLERLEGGAAAPEAAPAAPAVPEAAPAAKA